MARDKRPKVIFPDLKEESRKLPELKYGADSKIRNALTVVPPVGVLAQNWREAIWIKYGPIVKKYMLKYLSLRESSRLRGLPGTNKKALKAVYDAIGIIEHANHNRISLLLTEGQDSSRDKMDLWARWGDERLKGFFSELRAFKAEFGHAMKYFAALTKQSSADPERYLAARLAEVFFEVNHRSPTQREHVALTAAVVESLRVPFRKHGLNTVCKLAAAGLMSVERIPPRKSR